MNGTDCSLVFPPDPLWVRSAREAVRTLLASVRAPELTDSAVLLTSEVVTNAVNACRSTQCSAPLTVYARYGDPGALRVFVHDEAPGAPTRQPAHAPAPGCDTERGRGLALLDACAAEWGICRHGPNAGKTVWFQLAAPTQGRTATVEWMRQMVSEGTADFSRQGPPSRPYET